MKEKILATIVPTAIKFEINEKEVTAFLANITDKDGKPTTLESAVVATTVKLLISPEDMRFFVDSFIGAGREYEKTYERSIGFSIGEEEGQYGKVDDVPN